MADEAPALRFVTARQIGQAIAPGVRWVVKPWIAAGAITEVAGKIKSAGKTTWLTHACRACLDGADFLGFPTAKTGVVYLTEQTPSTFRAALERAGLADRDDLAVLFWHEARKVPWPGVAQAAVAECVRRRAGLLVVDTLPQFVSGRGDDENKTGDALLALQPLQAAAAQGLAVVVVRHERKSGGEVGDAARGASAFGGAVDVLVSVRRAEGNARPTLRVLHALSRFDETPDSLVVALQDDGYVSLGDEKRLALIEARRRVSDALPPTEATALRIDALQEAAEVPTRTIAQDALNEMLADGRALRKGKGVKNDPFVYWRGTAP